MVTDDIECSIIIYTKENTLHYTIEGDIIMTRIVKIPFYNERKLALRFGFEPTIQHDREEDDPEFVEVDWDELLEDRRKRLKYRLDDAEELARQKPSDIIELAFACHTYPKEIIEQIQDMVFWQDIVYYVWEHYFDVFETAFDLYRLDNARWGTPRCGIGPATLTVTNDILKTFETELCSYFQQHQKGRFCSIRLLQRGPDQFQFLAAIDDCPKTILWHDSQGKVYRKKEIIAFELGFRYNVPKETLEISGTVSPKVRRDLGDLFIETVLQMEPAEIVPQKINLETIRDKRFSLRTRPEYSVQANMEYIFVHWMANDRKTMVFTGGNWDNIKDALEFNYPTDKRLQELVNTKILKAHFTFQFSGTLHRCARSFQVDVDVEKQRVSFKTIDEGCRDIVLSCLRDWGVIHDN